MNKSQLVDALADRLGDRRTAATAVDALLQIVVDTVRSGESVSIAGFGVFESRARAARTGRNPRTGETVEVPATTVPAFRPGTGFRSAVSGEDAPAVAPPRRTRATAATNGAVDGAASALNGAVELTAPAAATLVADPAPEADKGKRGKATAKPAAKKVARKVDDKKADAKKDDRKPAKGKKGKK